MQCRAEVAKTHHTRARKPANRQYRRFGLDESLEESLDGALGRARVPTDLHQGLSESIDVSKIVARIDPVQRS